MKHFSYTILFILIMLFFGVVTSSNGQGRTKKDRLNYRLKKEKIRKTENDSLQNMLIFRVAKNQVKSPRRISLKVTDLKDKTRLYARGAGKDLISGATVDAQGYFENTKEDFIFRVDSLPPGNYLIQCLVFQQNGDVLVIDKKEEL